MTIPFARLTDDEREAYLNQPGFLSRTIRVPIESLASTRSTFGFAPNATLGSASCEYAANARNGTAWGTAIYSVNVLRAVPFIHAVNLPLVQIAMNVSILGVGSKARIGVYDCEDDLAGNLYPGRLLVASAELDCGSAAYKTASVQASLVEGRVYWMAQVFGTATCTSSSIPVALSDTLLGHSGGTINTHLSVAYTYAALPASFPSGATMVLTAAPALSYLYGASRVAAPPRIVPAFFPSSPYDLTGVRIVSGSDRIAAGQTRPYVSIKAQFAEPGGRTTLGSFDGRVTPLKASTPFALFKGSKPIRQGQGVVLEVEEAGTPHASLADVAAFVDYSYTGAR